MTARTVRPTPSPTGAKTQSELDEAVGQATHGPSERSRRRGHLCQEPQARLAMSTSVVVGGIVGATRLGGLRGCICRGQRRGIGQDQPRGENGRDSSTAETGSIKVRNCARWAFDSNKITAARPSQNMSTAARPLLSVQSGASPVVTPIQPRNSIAPPCCEAHSPRIASQLSGSYTPTSQPTTPALLSQYIPLRVLPASAVLTTESHATFTGVGGYA
jgi:hypothetical protein